MIYWGDRPFDNLAAQDFAFDVVRNAISVLSSASGTEQHVAQAAILVALLGDKTILSGCGYLVDWCGEQEPDQVLVKNRLDELLGSLPAVAEGCPQLSTAVGQIVKASKNVRCRNFKPVGIRKARSLLRTLTTEYADLDTEQLTLGGWSCALAAAMSCYRQVTDLTLRDEGRYGRVPGLLNAECVRMLLRNWKLESLTIELILGGDDPDPQIELSGFEQEISLLPLEFLNVYRMKCDNEKLGETIFGPTLQWIKMEGCHLAASFLDVMNRLPRLCGIQLASCPGITSEAAVRFAEARPDVEFWFNRKELSAGTTSDQTLSVHVDQVVDFTLDDEMLTLESPAMGEKSEIFQSFADGWEGNGYDWTSVARVILADELPKYVDLVSFQPEAGLFEATGPNAVLKQLQQNLQAAYKNEARLRGLLGKAQLD